MCAASTGQFLKFLNDHHVKGGDTLTVSFVVATVTISSPCLGS